MVTIDGSVYSLEIDGQGDFAGLKILRTAERQPEAGIAGTRLLSAEAVQDPALFRFRNRDGDACAVIDGKIYKFVGETFGKLRFKLDPNLVVANPICTPTIIPMSSEDFLTFASSCRAPGLTNLIRVLFQLSEMCSSIGQIISTVKHF